MEGYTNTVGGNQEDILSVEKLARYKTEVRNDRNKGKASAEKQGERRGALRDIRRVERRYRNENVFCTAQWITRKRLNCEFM